LLESSLSPDVAFKGRMMVTHWFGHQTTAEEVEVYHAPPNLYRREYISPEGTVQRVQISDGDVEQNFLVRQNKTISGDAVKSYEKVMSPEREMALLLKNYELSVSTKADEVAGRKAWILELKPLVTGKSWQKLWIDQQVGLILENKKFLPKHHYAVLSRYSKIEIQKQVKPELFELTVSSNDVAGTGHGLEPDFLTLEELKKATGKNPSFPTDLPEGFAFESADYFPYRDHVVLHARYTDGLAVLSLFQTDLPVRVPKNATATLAPPTKGGGSIRLSTVGNVLNWKRGGQYFTLMGDVSKELLQSISAKLK
jgi:outer membrane lipoprotein-sorting protein